MAEQIAAKGPLPAVPYLKIPDQGQPYLEGYRCKECKEVYLDARQHCPKCSARDCLEPSRLSNQGHLYVY